MRGLLAGLLVLFFHNSTVPAWPYLVAGHVLALLGIHTLINFHARHPQWKLLDFLRHYYPGTGVATMY